MEKVEHAGPGRLFDPVKLGEALGLTLLTLLAIIVAYALEPRLSQTQAIPWETSPTSAIGPITKTIPPTISTMSFPSSDFTQTPTITVSLEGRGDYITLPAALKAASSGATILLGPGTFSLTKPLTLTQPIRLIGAGMDATYITAATANYVVRVTGDFIAEDLTFEHSGSLAADVVVIAGAQVWIKRCRFRGAVLAETEGRFGAGLRLTEAASGLIADTRAEENGAMGIVIEGTSYPTLENNVTRENQLAGIAWLGHARGTARANESHANFIGFLVNDEAQPILEANLGLANQKSGLAYRSNSGGLARQNQFSNNGREGIYIGAQAYPTLETNVCTENAAVGIAYFDNSSGIARSNTCTHNLRGIYVGEQAAPTLEENLCNANEKSGITYAGQAGGVARHNTCAENGITGLYIGEQAHPTLEENLSHANGEVGIAYLDTAGGIARDNRCTENPLCLHIAPTANPTLENNTCGE